MEESAATREAGIAARVAALPIGEVSIYEDTSLFFVRGRLIGQFGRAEDAVNYAHAQDDMRYLLTELAAARQQAADATAALVGMLKLVDDEDLLYEMRAAADPDSSSGIGYRWQDVAHAIENEPRYLVALAIVEKARQLVANADADKSEGADADSEEV